MSVVRRRRGCRAGCLALVVALVGSLAVDAGPRGAAAARLEGRVAGIDGRPAARHRVHVLGAGGGSAARCPTGEDGEYACPALPPGRYALAVEDPLGRFAPVAGPPLRLGPGARVRRDLKLLATRPAARERVVRRDRTLLGWWGGLSTAGKLWVVTAVVIGAGIGVLARSGDDRQVEASPSGAS